MNPPVLDTSPVKDGRRILGEKSANAGLNRGADVTPVKRKALFETGSSPKKLLPSPEFTSRKRSIAQVEKTQADDETATAQRESPPQLQEGNSSQATVVDDDRPDGAIDPHTRRHPEEAQSRLNSPSLGLTPPHTIPDDPESRKVFVQEKATLLRTRIQRAMPRVKDHQLDRRLSALEAHSRKYQRRSCASTPQREGTETHPPPLTHTPQAPPLHPAAAGGTDSRPMAESGLSSPPPSADNANQHDHVRTTTQDDLSGATKSPVQLSSPPVSVLGPARNAAETEGAATGKVATPPQQGDAIDGLLKLMNTADR